ncbi:formimidoylglutamate deiminase [Rhizomonospora bruguierae]|uniref:formimidoylglutamate deiminase n=1 Tax=Rhizomonospora bruguierae TaxID=1581705 RepID=UPI001BCEEC9E|nr:formimidoylglutamate deiminase [Micromonospora sp. NBRC 107566]
MSRYRCQYAWLGDAPVADVTIEIADGRISAVWRGEPGVPLPGLTLPGFANAHSHAFHRALRGRTHADRGSFWTWRDAMYAVADRLDPQSYFTLARAVYAEMALAGIACVGEFHYLHHAAGGARYNNPNAMGEALIAAAAEAGIRITLLDTAYLTASVAGEPLGGTQLRFGDGSVHAWAARADARRPHPHAVLGAAIHSVRAVPAEAVPTVAAYDGPLHVHLSEQPAENDACLAHYGRTPAAVLDDGGALGPRTTAVHATHLTPHDIALLGQSGTGACLCPTTERDLADGIGPARDLLDAGSPLSLGSDGHSVIDPFEEARAVEADERLRTRQRGWFTAADLVRAATVAGHRALGWDDAGTIAVGARADLVTVRMDTPRTAGVDPAGLVFAATAADICSVIVDGRVVARDGRHATIDVPHALATAIGAIT